MDTPKINHKKQMFDQLCQVIENAGTADPNYDSYQKAIDILDVLESLLAYSIYNTCNSAATIRDSCEESYVNIKRRALNLWENEQHHEEKNEVLEKN